MVETAFTRFNIEFSYIYLFITYIFIYFQKCFREAQLYLWFIYACSFETDKLSFDGKKAYYVRERHILLKKYTVPVRIFLI